MVFDSINILLRIACPVCVLSIMLFLSGCGGVTKARIPDDIASKNLGVMFAELYHTFDKTNISEVEILIKRTVNGYEENTYRVPVHNHITYLELPPGEYKLDMLYIKPLYTRYIKMFPINRAFRISKGKVTNLGMMLLDQSVAQFGYIDNTDRAIEFFRTNYPKLFANIGQNGIILTEGTYVTKENFIDMRSVIATSRLSSLYAGSYPFYWNDKVAIGPAGTIASIQKVGENYENLQVYEIDTIADIVSADQHNDRFGFVMDDGAAYTLLNERLVKIPVPDAFKPKFIHLYGQHGVVLIDDKMLIYDNHDSSDDWMRHEEFINKGSDRVVEYGGFNNGNDVYLFTQGLGFGKPVLLFRQIGNNNYSAVELPKSAGYIRSLYVNESGIYLTPSFTMIGSNFYLHRSTKGKWTEIPFPKRECYLLKASSEGDRVDLQCGSWKAVSVDYGKTWSYEE